MTSKRARRAARRLFRLCVNDGMLDERRARRVSLRLARSGRRRALEVLGGFSRLVRLEQHRRTAVVESAVPLPADVRNDVRGILTRRYGTGLEMVYAHDPALIGGIRVQVGSSVYDGTVRGRLAALNARM